MDCKECESILEAYALGELPENPVMLSEAKHLDAGARSFTALRMTSPACHAHLEACPKCREALEACVRIMDAIACQPVPVPSESESAALAEALAGVELCPPVERKVIEPVPQGFPAFLLASVLAFVAVATALALQMYGVVSVGSLVGRIGLPWIALMIVVTVFVTSFIPIAVTAHRRPLNGMTFRG
jgi:hypothetical protein